MPVAKRGKKLAPMTAPLSRDELARYIADQSGELALLAGRARWPLLTYLLNMARIEAEARASSGDRIASNDRSLPDVQSG